MCYEEARRQVRIKAAEDGFQRGINQQMPYQPGTERLRYRQDIVYAARLILGVLAVASFSSRLVAQPCSTFEVASIKLNTNGFGGGSPELAPGGRRFTATNQLMVMLIMFAYDVSPDQISGIPGASAQDRYDIDATCEQPMTKEQLPRLLQGLLAERFRLSIHRGVKDQPTYALVPGKRGPKFL